MDPAIFYGSISTILSLNRMVLSHLTLIRKIKLALLSSCAFCLWKTGQGLSPSQLYHGDSSSLRDRLQLLVVTPTTKGQGDCVYIRENGMVIFPTSAGCLDY